MGKHQSSKMGRAPCCEKLGLKKGPWTPEEDKKLLAYIHQHGLGSWRSLPPKAGLERCGKSCRLRWTNYLRPDIKRGKFTLQEEQSIIQLHALLGNRWSAIATHLPKRTDNEIKNYWNTHLKKKLTKMGIDPVTHKPINNHQTPPLSATATYLSAGQQNTGVATSLSHMAQWETARLEAEARLARQSKLRSHSSSSHSERDDGIKVWCNRWSSKSTEGSAEITLPAIGNVSGDLESPTTSTVTFLGNTPPSTAAGVVGKSENLQEAENQEGVGNCLSFSPSLHEMSFLSIEGTQNVARNDDFSEVLLKNSDDDNDPRDGQPSDGGAESENGGPNHNNDYWDTIIGEFHPFDDSPTLEI